ncbi:MAG: hypothetical protein H6Q88_264 [Anaeromyxobacteraceae bacterium]|nr:hypothetical protein [Anaeromyxobacteraceae bacterium]
MRTRTMAFALVIATWALSPGSSRAAEDPALLKDMTAVLALLGLPCGQVVSVVPKGENDHVATCKDGNRYRIFLNAEGRVVAEKQ